MVCDKNRELIGIDCRDLVKLRGLLNAPRGIF